MKQKGFTLIELLAVIVILAIIALIATPMILNVIEKARAGSAESSVLGYVDAIDKYIISSEINNQVLSDNVYQISEIDKLLDYKGTKPTNGYVNINNGSVTSAILCFNKYAIEYKNNISKITNQKCDKINASVIKNKVANITAPSQKISDIKIYGNTINNTKLGNEGYIEVVVNGKNLLNLKDLNINDSGLSVEVKNQNININGCHNGGNGGFFIYESSNSNKVPLINDNNILNGNSYNVSWFVSGDITINPNYVNNNGLDEAIVRQIEDNIMGICILINDSIDSSLDLGKCFIRSDGFKTNEYNTSNRKWDYLFLQHYTCYDNVLLKTQLEYGDIKTEYEPYKETRYKIVLKDKNGNVINGIGTNEVIEKINGIYGITNDAGEFKELNSETNKILNDIKLYDGVSNVYIDNENANSIEIMYYK